MNLFRSSGDTENHVIYQTQQADNLDRQLSFLKSVTISALSTNQRFLSHSIIKHLNFHAITCLHDYAGEYRPHEVSVKDVEGNTTHQPPETYQVPSMMDDCINFTNSFLAPSEPKSPVELAAWVLWSMNYIHPFVNGNGRTARAASYFVLCLKCQRWLPGNPILPSLIQQNREEYITLLRGVDQTSDFEPLVQFLTRLLREQLNISEELEK